MIFAELLLKKLAKAWFSNGEFIRRSSPPSSAHFSDHPEIVRLSPACKLMQPSTGCKKYPEVLQALKDKMYINISIAA